MFDLESLFIIGVIIISAFTQGLISFGFGLISIPSLLLLFSPDLVVPLANLLGPFITIPLCLYYWKKINVQRIFLLLIGGIFGVYFGVNSFLLIDISLLKGAISIIVLLFSILMLKGYGISIKEKFLLVPIGFLSSFLGGLMGFSGLPMVLFFSNQGLNKEEFKATLASFFLLINLMCIYMYIGNGVITKEILDYFFLTVPFLICATVLGIYTTRFFSQNVFKKSILGLLCVISLFLLINF